MSTSITARQYFQSVLDAHLSDEMDAMSAKYIAGLDARNAKRKETPTKEQKEASARRGLVLGFLQSNPTECFTRDQIAEKVGVTPAQVTAACRMLGDSVTKSEAKVDKTRRVVYQYRA